MNPPATLETGVTGKLESGAAAFSDAVLTGPAHHGITWALGTGLGDIGITKAGKTLARRLLFEECRALVRARPLGAAAPRPDTCHHAMNRFVLTETQWVKMEPLCLGKPGDPGCSGENNRLFVEGVLWIARSGSPWRDLPHAFGHWNSVYMRFRDWVKADVWKRLLEACSDEPNMEYAMVDATIVKVHRHGPGAKGGLKARLSAVRKAA